MFYELILFGEHLKIFVEENYHSNLILNVFCLYLNNYNAEGEKEIFWFTILFITHLPNTCLQQSIYLN